MATKAEYIKKHGQARWDQICKTGFLDAITVTVNRALCKCQCEKCGKMYNVCIGPPFSWTTRLNCECGRWKGLHIIEMLKCDTDIPLTDIRNAERAADGKPVLDWD